MSVYEKFLLENDYREDGFIFEDSPSWELAWGAASEWFDLVPTYTQIGGPQAVTTTLGALLHCVYYAGYKRGKQESPPFLLPKED